MFDFLKRFTGKKEETATIAEEELKLLEKFEGSTAELIQQAQKNPQVLDAIKALVVRMQKDGVDIKNKERVKAWVEQHKEELAQEAKRATAKVATVVHVGPRAGRNDPCPCGSGKKHKKCCLSKEVK